MRPCEGGSRCQRPLVRRTLTPGRSSPVRHRTNAVRRSSSARAVRREADAAEPRGVTATYLRACARCGCPPDPGVAADLSEHGALIVDLRLCTAEALHAVCALLREGPAGVRQIVLRDGLASLGSDVAYREKAYAHRKRGRTLLKPKQASMCSCGHAAVDGAEFCTKCGKKRPKDDPPPLDAAPLRLLVAALACFLAGRGAKLEVLDLAGMPLGREVPTLLSPLAVALRNARLRELRWLGLSGCRLSDRGLGLLLPWLAGADNFLPRLEGLALAWNGFSDVRLVDALIRARARLCYERRAAPLRLLDLSGNPRLCEVGAPSTPAAVTPASISARRRGGTGVAPRLGANAPGKASAQGCPKRRAALIRSISCALAEGLPLRVLRLRRMRLDDEVLQPLLQLMQAETRRCVVSAGALAGASGFCMEEVDLEGNQLDDEFLEAVADCLRLLGAVRECPLSSAAPDPFPPARTMEHQSNASQPIGDTIPPAAQEVQRRSQSGATHNGAAIGLRRAASCPASPQFERTPTTAPSPDDAAAIAAVAAISGGSSAQLLSPVTAALLTRDALSDVGESQVHGAILCHAGLSLYKARHYWCVVDLDSFTVLRAMFKRAQSRLRIAALATFGSEERVLREVFKRIEGRDLQHVVTLLRKRAANVSGFHWQRSWSEAQQDALQLGASATHEGADGRTPLMAALLATPRHQMAHLANNVSALQALYDAAPLSLRGLTAQHALRCYGNTAGIGYGELQWGEVARSAAKEWRLDAALGLLYLGGQKLATVVDVQGRNALHYAAAAGDVEIVQRLQRFGANACKQDNMGRTPAHFAAMRGHVDLARNLCSPSDGSDDQLPALSCKDQHGLTVGSILESHAQVWTRGVPRVNNIGVDVLLNQFVAAGIPVVAEGGGSHLPALQKWADPSALSDRLGGAQLSVGIVPYPKNYGLEGREATFAEFIQGAKTQRGDAPDYVFDVTIARRVPDLLADVDLLPVNLCDRGLVSYIRYPQFGVGPRGAGAPMHNHYGALNVLVAGVKRWFLSPPASTFWGISPTCDFVVSKEFEKLQNQGALLEVVQHAGDLVFVPEGWGHATLLEEYCVGVGQEFIASSSIFS